MIGLIMKTMNKDIYIDIKENDILKIDEELLAILLKDKTTGKNIIWATDNYKKNGASYNPDQEIKIELITGYHGSIIRPRISKSKTEQQQRIRQKAEVFTPSWICNIQNNQIDEKWFEQKNIFNIEKENNWETIKEKIVFPNVKDKTWQDYLSTKRLEITCGEAPYLTSRYDSVTGDFIAVKDRIGILDRKLRVVCENTDSRDEWLKWAYIAVQNIYGFDWQGDNVLIARENILFNIAEHYEYKFNQLLTTQDLIGFAKVIAWNIFQMDGLKFVIPNSCCKKTIVEETLFGTEIISKECIGCKKGDNKKHNGIYCKVKDWETHQTVRFIDLFEGKENGK